jgi:hypothetical protein
MGAFQDKGLILTGKHPIHILGLEKIERYIPETDPDITLP